MVEPDFSLMATGNDIPTATKNLTCYGGRKLSQKQQSKKKEGEGGGRQSRTGQTPTNLVRPQGRACEAAFLRETYTHHAHDHEICVYPR